MGNQQSTLPEKNLSTNSSSSSTTTSSSSSGGCPVKHSSTAQPKEMPSSKCPVKHSGKKQKYNVYSEPIDPTNQMPVNPNQFPHQAQKMPLNTGRVKSPIPKGGTEDDDSNETWTYPSEQMFFNALKRKGKGSDAEEEDMSTIIAIHNNMNERTWNRVLEFEKTFHCADCPTPKLLKFIGRPHDLSLKARLKTWTGSPIPFDRHDWTLDRCGTTVRYIIDYYHDEDEESDVKPHLNSRTDVKSITVDVRPAPFDSFTNFIDAVRMPFCEAMGTVADVYEDDDVEHEPTHVDNDDSGIKRPDVHHEEVFSTMQTFREQCQKTAEVLQKCNGEEDCARKKMALDVCFGKIICPTEANNFSNDPSEETYEPLNQCIAKFRASAT